MSSDSFITLHGFWGLDLLSSSWQRQASVPEGQRGWRMSRTSPSWANDSFFDFCKYAMNHPSCVSNGLKYIKEENIPPLIFWQDSGVAWTRSRGKSGYFEESDTQLVFFAVFVQYIIHRFPIYITVLQCSDKSNIRQKKWFKCIRWSEMQCKNIKTVNLLE